MGLSGHRRALVVVLAAASVMGLAGTAAASLPKHAEVAAPAAASAPSGASTAGAVAASGAAAVSSTVVQPAAFKAIPIKIIGRKRLVQSTGGSATLLTLEAVTFRAVCTDVGGGYTLVELQAKSTALNAFVVGPVGGGIGLTTSFQTIFNIQANHAAGQDQTFDVLLKKGLTRRFDIVYAVDLPGADCVTQLTAYNG